MISKTKEKVWLTKEKRPIIIAGPCSAETEEQVFQTAKRLKDAGKCDIIRAGIWKPRTRPDAFEGVGAVGLPWLQRVKAELNLPVTVEVANAKHVELCLDHGIDMLWIGARSTVNPFVVQEIADVLKGVDIPVLVKNPINPELALWLGAIERLEKSGIKELGAIHRGFSNLSEDYYRNRPHWQIAIEFARKNPTIPLICDPSHICGRRDILLEVAQKAMDLDYDGLMIESHIDPDNAWSDARQQITPEVFGEMISHIVIREDFEDDEKMQSSLDMLRQELDHIDEELLNLLSNRMKISRDIGKYKKENNMTIFQPRRWSEIHQRYINLASSRRLNEDFIRKFIDAVHEESINQQEALMMGKNDANE